MTLQASRFFFKRQSHWFLSSLSRDLIASFFVKYLFLRAGKIMIDKIIEKNFVKKLTKKRESLESPTHQRAVFPRGGWRIRQKIDKTVRFLCPSPSEWPEVAVLV